MARRSPEPAASPVRGAVLVVVAIVVGLFLLRNGIDTSETIVADDDPTPTTEAPTDDGGETDGGATDGETDGSTTPSTEAVRPPGQVRVVVLNGSSVDGAATTWSNGVQAFGYSMLTPGNANAGVDATQVFHQPGFQPEAAALIVSLGSPAGVVPQKVGNPPPGEIGDADVVVVLGPDLASGTPPSPGAGGGNTTGAG